jgi:hypothetical protein
MLYLTWIFLCLCYFYPSGGLFSIMVFNVVHVNGHAVIQPSLLQDLDVNDYNAMSFEEFCALLDRVDDEDFVISDDDDSTGEVVGDIPVPVADGEGESFESLTGIPTVIPFDYRDLSGVQEDAQLFADLLAQFLNETLEDGADVDNGSAVGGDSGGAVQQHHDAFGVQGRSYYARDAGNPFDDIQPLYDLNGVEGGHYYG